MFILCLLLLSATACGEGSGEGPDDSPGKTPSSMTPADTDGRLPVDDGSVEIEIDVDVMAALRESDKYGLRTDGDYEPVIENDRLTLVTSYGGGCGDNDFTLVTDGDFMESDTDSDHWLHVALTHVDNDPCEAIEEVSYSFNLTDIKTRYQERYEEDSITLRLWHREYPSGDVASDPLDIVYTFAP